MRKPSQSQAGTLLEQNAPRSTYNNSYGQGGYQNRSQQSGSAMMPRQDTQMGQKDPNAMNVDRTQEQRPPIKCYKCQKMGHMMKDC